MALSSKVPSPFNASWDNLKSKAAPKMFIFQPVLLQTNKATY